MESGRLDRLSLEGPDLEPEVSELLRTRTLELRARLSRQKRPRELSS